MNRFKRLLVLALVLGVGLWAFLFSLANSDAVALDLVVLRLAPAALAVWIIAAFVAGGLCGLAAGSVAIWRAQRALTRLRRAPAAALAAKTQGVATAAPPLPSGEAVATR
jgi:putative membrane protein